MNYTSASLQGTEQHCWIPCQTTANKILTAKLLLLYVH